MNITSGVVTKVEAAQDMPGWIVYFEDNKLFFRLKAKYRIQPQLGDRIVLYGFPKTHKLEINNKVIYMHEHNYYDVMKKSINVCNELENTVRKMKISV